MALIKPSKIVTEKIAFSSFYPFEWETCRLIMTTLTWPGSYVMMIRGWNRNGCHFSTLIVLVQDQYIAQCTVCLLNAVITSTNKRNWDCVQILAIKFFFVKVFLKFCGNRYIIYAISVVSLLSMQ